MPSDELNFAGKVVTVYIRIGSLILSEQPSWTLDSPRIEEQLGRTFLVGKAISDPDASPAWYHGASINIPWESVSHYIVFNSNEAFHAANSRHRDGVPKPRWFGRSRRA